MTRRLLIQVGIAALALIVFLSALVWYNLQQPQSTLPTVPISIGTHAIEVEVAATPDQRARGLMFRQMLTTDGMLFLYPRSEEREFWMRNTSIPLSIAFFDHDGRILNIADLQPFDETPVRSTGFACCALEVAQGWFTEHNIQPGHIVQFTMHPTIEMTAPKRKRLGFKGMPPHPTESRLERLETTMQDVDCAFTPLSSTNPQSGQ